MLNQVLQNGLLWQVMFLLVGGILLFILGKMILTAFRVISELLVLGVALVLIICGIIFALYISANINKLEPVIQSGAEHIVNSNGNSLD